MESKPFELQTQGFTLSLLPTPLKIRNSVMQPSFPEPVQPLRTSTGLQTDVGIPGTRDPTLCFPRMQ